MPNRGSIASEAMAANGSRLTTTTTTRLYNQVNGHAVALRQIANDGTHAVFYSELNAAPPLYVRGGAGFG